MITKDNLVKGGRYNWRGQNERLVYMGRHIYRDDHRPWYQFALVESPSEIWCEVLETDFQHFEETAQPEGAQS